MLEIFVRYEELSVLATWSPGIFVNLRRMDVALLHCDGQDTLGRKDEIEISVLSGGSGSYENI